MKQRKGRKGKGKSRETRRPRRAPQKPRGAAKPFEFLDHPADVGFRARGRTLEELFANAARALCNYGWEQKNVRGARRVTVRIRAATLEDLLFSWLSELVFLTDAEKWVFGTFAVRRIRRRRAGPPTAVGNLATETQSTRRKESGDGGVWDAEATASGARFDASRHRARTYIKAVTYHQLAVRRTPAGWDATVYLDV